MTLLAELEKAIQELEAQKEALLEEIQKFGWKDDRSFEPIPEQVMQGGFELESLDAPTVVPARSPLPPDCNQNYQQWYSAARAVLARNQPGRIAEFDEAYSPTGKGANHGIKQLLSERHLTQGEQFKLMDLINMQFEILSAVTDHLRFSMYDIELTAYSVLMDDEINAARHLLLRGFLRPAGVLAGVILERHLKNLLRKHTPPIKYRERDSLASLNDLCKDAVYDLVTWRKVQHLADLRNLCAHDKTREPTKEEVTDLINGVSAILRTYNT